MLNGNRLKSHRARSPRDLYETPFELADAAIHKLRVDGGFSNRTPLSALDAGCGNGVWGRAMNRLIFFMQGIDLEPFVIDDGSYDMVTKGDYLEYAPEHKYDLVFGNPPYSLAEDFIRHAFTMLETGGSVYFLLRLSFLEGIGRCRGLFKEFPLKRVYVCSRRPSFFSSDNSHHTTDTLAYAMFLWQKGFSGRPIIDFLDWNYVSKDSSS